MNPFNRNTRMNPQTHPQHQRFFATRGPELLPIRREVIRAEEPAMVTAKPALPHMAPAVSSPQPSMTWPLLSPAVSNPLMMATASAMQLLELPPALVPAGSQQQPMLTPPLLMHSAAELPLFSSLMGPLPVGFEPMAHAASEAALAPAVMGYPQQQQEQPAASPTISSHSSASEPSQAALDKVDYLNVPQFRRLQALIREHGEDWELLGRLMGIRPHDLAKGWPGYSVDTKITSTWTQAETEILALCRSLGISCTTTAKILTNKLTVQIRRKNINKRPAADAAARSCRAKRRRADTQCALACPGPCADDAAHPQSGPAASDTVYPQSRPAASDAVPPQPGPVASDAAPRPPISDDIKWDTGHVGISYEPRVLMPTAASSIVTNLVEAHVKQHGHVDWAAVSQQAGLSLQDCLELSTYAGDKQRWAYDVSTFTWKQAETLKAFIAQLYPAPTPIDFLAVSNFFRIHLPDCIKMYEMLRGDFEWTASSLALASRLAAQGLGAEQIARQLSPTMGAARVEAALLQNRARSPEIQLPPAVDARCEALVRAIVAQHLAASDDLDVPRLLEYTRRACPALPAETADRTTLTILCSFPQFASQKKKRSPAKPAPRLSDAPAAAASTPSRLDSCSARNKDKWSCQEIRLLEHYAQLTNATKNWRYFSNLLGTKSPAQCTNKYRSECKKAKARAASK